MHPHNFCHPGTNKMFLFILIASIEAKSLRKRVRAKECSMVAFLSVGRIKVSGGGGGGGKSATVKNEVVFNGFTESTSLVQFKSCVL